MLLGFWERSLINRQASRLSTTGSSVESQPHDRARCSPRRAGKTSLLCALAGKATYGTVTGRIFVNGCLDRLDRYKKVL